MQTITKTNGQNLMYSFAQMLTHHTSTGCPMAVGDLLGSGTVSGVDADSKGCLLEMTSNGSKPLHIVGTGEQRTFLQDGDAITLRGYCGDEKVGGLVGFGECVGTIHAAK